jgi:hypothetical protein
MHTFEQGKSFNLIEVTFLNKIQKKEEHVENQNEKIKMK